MKTNPFNITISPYEAMQINTSVGAPCCDITVTIGIIRQKKLADFNALLKLNHDTYIVLYPFAMCDEEHDIVIL